MDAVARRCEPTVLASTRAGGLAPQVHRAMSGRDARAPTSMAATSVDPTRHRPWTHLIRSGIDRVGAAMNVLECPSFSGQVSFNPRDPWRFFACLAF